MQAHNLEDIEVIRRIVNKDKNALYQLYDKYSGALFGVILRICQEQTLAEDVLQETFVKIWEKIDTYDPKKGKFYTWAYRIAKNKALNAVRNMEPLIQKEDLSVVKDKSATETYIDFNQLNGALNRLEPHHKEALSLVYFKGYTHREANKEMGVPLGTFKSYVRQALKVLRENYQGSTVLMWWLFEMML